MLNGQTVLIIETEFLVALDIQQMLEALSAGSILVARTAREAHDLKPQWPAIDLAIVELGQNDAQTSAILADLRDCGAFVVLCSADSTLTDGHPDYPGVPLISKPMVEEDFRSAIIQALANPPRMSGYAS